MLTHWAGEPSQDVGGHKRGENGVDHRLSVLHRRKVVRSLAECTVESTCLQRSIYMYGVGPPKRLTEVSGGAEAAHAVSEPVGRMKYVR